MKERLILKLKLSFLPNNFPSGKIFVLEDITKMND